MSHTRRQSSTTDRHIEPASPVADPRLDPTHDWEHHEHLADAVRVQAQRLIGEAGTPELAQQALETVAHDLDAQREMFAHDLGFDSYADLVGAAQAVESADGQVWLAMAVKSTGWVVWNERYLQNFGRLKEERDGDEAPRPPEASTTTPHRDRPLS